MQILQKVQTLTNAPEGKHNALRTGEGDDCLIEDQGNFNLFYL